MNPFTALAEPLGVVLTFFYAIIPNFGVSIILLTVAVNLVLFPLTLKQTRSMRAMQEIQPEVKRLQKEHKEDKEKLNQELMALYRERGVNPAAGCLPLLLQMPIWFSLFRLLLRPENYIHTGTALLDAINGGQTRFLGMELGTTPAGALPDGVVGAIPYLILVVLIIASGYYQQRQATMRRGPQSDTTQPGAQQMQTVMKVMPVLFGFISWTLASGVDLYILAGNFFRIGQQYIIFRLDDERRAEEQTEQRPAPAKAAETEEKPAPRPQQGSKKKRKKKRR